MSSQGRLYAIDWFEVLRTRISSSASSNSIEVEIEAKVGSLLIRTEEK